MSVSNLSGFGVLQSCDVVPFRFIPQRIHLNKDHEFFEDGDIYRHLYLQNLTTSETDDKPKLSVSEFGCHISGCRQVFSSVEEHEHHYNSLHRHVCCTCQRSFPSPRLLDIHIEEWHDSLFNVLSQTQDMYQCLVEGCGQKFRTSKQRKDHLIRIHKYPPDFRFDRAKRDKVMEKKRQQKQDTSMEVMEGVCESASTSEDVRGASDQQEDMEAVELQAPPGPGTQGSTCMGNSASFAMHSAAASPCATTTGTDQQKPRYSYRVPATVCFGQGSVRGFRGRGRRK